MDCPSLIKFGVVWHYRRSGRSSIINGCGKKKAYWGIFLFTSVQSQLLCNWLWYDFETGGSGFQKLYSHTDFSQTTMENCLAETIIVSVIGKEMPLFVYITWNQRPNGDISLPPSAA